MGDRVLNIRDLGKVGTWPKDVRRIDRRSPYGNPFKIDDPWLTWVSVMLGYKADAAGKRDASIALYRAWLTRNTVVMGPDDGSTEGGSIEFSNGTVRTMGQHVQGLAATFSTFYPAPVLPPRPDIERLRGFRLACWCAPLPCHGDVLVELIP
jgi:hypothetical protein